MKDKNKRGHFAGGVFTPPLTKGEAPLEIPEYGSPPQVAGFMINKREVFLQLR
jgi:hypothetical protein